MIRFYHTRIFQRRIRIMLRKWYWRLNECTQLTVPPSGIWRLFIDSSKSSLKAALVHNGNKYQSVVPAAYSTRMTVNYANMKRLLEKLGYDSNEWFLSSSLKIMVTHLIHVQCASGTDKTRQSIIARKSGHIDMSGHLE